LPCPESRFEFSRFFSKDSWHVRRESERTSYERPEARRALYATIAPSAKASARAPSGQGDEGADAGATAQPELFSS
ncbi:unnamed protein product, partial [marine sediment metagenome]